MIKSRKTFTSTLRQTKPNMAVRTTFSRNDSCMARITMYVSV